MGDGSVLAAVALVLGAGRNHHRATGIPPLPTLQVQATAAWTTAEVPSTEVTDLPFSRTPDHFREKIELFVLTLKAAQISVGQPRTLE